MSRQNKRRLAQYGATAIFGIIILSYLVSLIAPNATPNVTEISDDDLQIRTPLPTQVIPPTPEPNGPQLTMGETVVQRNGLFQAAVPTDWIVQRNDYDPNIPRARVTFASSNRLSIIEMLLQPGVNYPTLQALSDEFFTNDYFFGAWADYDGFTETERSIGDERVVVDFELSAAGVDYLGRQVAWLDGDWLHMIRIIVPDNNPALLEELTRLTSEAFISYADQREGDFNFFAYSDPQQGFMFRHPAWNQLSGSVGSPTIFEDPETDARLLVRSFEDTMLEDLTAAEEFLTTTYRIGAEVLASQVTNREFGEGFMISYSDTDNESNEVSGLVVLLNAPNGKLLVADIRLPQADIDLLSTDSATRYNRQLAVMKSFMPLPPSSPLPAE